MRVHEEIIQKQIQGDLAFGVCRKYPTTINDDMPWRTVGLLKW
jgi:hypothetical protein